MKFIMALASVSLLSSLLVSTAHGSIYLDKDIYTWTDKVHIRAMVHGWDAREDTIRVYTSDHELDSYKLSKAGNGLYTGEIILTGFLHDVDGDGKPDTNPRTMGSGSNNGFLESGRDGRITILMEFADGGVESKSAKISWNVGEISLDSVNYQPDEFAKLGVSDPDMNLNPETLDKIKVSVSSDSDKAGIIVNAIETGEESGIFETEFSFVQDSASSGDRLFAVNGDWVYAIYEDRTLPSPHNIRDDLDVIAEAKIGDMPVQSIDSKIESDEKTNPPLRQIREGIMLENVTCKESLVLVYKFSNGNPACVTQNTAEVLLSRGWADQFEN